MKCRFPVIVFIVIFLIENAGALSCGETITDDTTMTADIVCNDTAVRIGKNSITLDCAGHTISGKKAGSGIYITDVDDATIKNCVVTKFRYGIVLSGSNNNALISNTISGNNIGILLDESNNGNTITGNKLSENKDGIYIDESNNNVLTHNIVNRNTRGIRLYNSYNNDFTENIADYNLMDGLKIDEQSRGNMIKNNQFCFNNQMGGSYLDIDNQGLSQGDNNTCGTMYNLDDIGDDVVAINVDATTGATEQSGAGGCTHYCNHIGLMLAWDLIPIPLVFL